MSTPTEATAYTTDELAEVEAVVMARLDKIEQAHTQAVAELREQLGHIGDLLAAMGATCQALSAACDRFTAAS